MDRYIFLYYFSATVMLEYCFPVTTDIRRQTSLWILYRVCGHSSPRHSLCHLLRHVYLSPPSPLSLTLPCRRSPSIIRVWWRRIGTATCRARGEIRTLYAQLCSVRRPLRHAPFFFFTSDYHVSQNPLATRVDRTTRVPLACNERWAQVSPTRCNEITRSLLMVDKFMI